MKLVMYATALLKGYLVGTLFSLAFGWWGFLAAIFFGVLELVQSELVSKITTKELLKNAEECP